MGLFATVPVDEVTVQDIANAVSMTPAAVYYHFASKEQILLEGMQNFRDEMLDEMRTFESSHSIAELVQHIVAWATRRRTAVTVYFVSSIGLNMMVEALRRETREEMVDIIDKQVRTIRGRISTAESAVIAVSLVSLIETSLASMVNQDAAYRGLGSRRFSAEVAAIGERITG